jgi:hypothetical protein
MKRSECKAAKKDAGDGEDRSCDAGEQTGTTYLKADSGSFISDGKHDARCGDAVMR